jgi:hypothetical protein
MTLSDFITLWSSSGASERANKDSYIRDLADVLGVPHPAPCTGDRARDTYVFEADALVLHEGGAVSIGKMDLYKAGCFVLEAKQGSHAGSAKVGSARRNTPSWSIAMQDAYGQALNYARTLANPPPFLVVADIGYCFDLYASFDESGIYRPYKDGQSARIFLADLPRHVETLRAIWTDPHSLDPARRKARVTTEIAGHIAELASALEEAGHKPEVVAKFLMRVLFTMFAEDVGLLRDDLFTHALEQRWCKDPASFPREVEALWTAMNTGGELFMAGRILQFNGGLFSEPKALPLDATQLRTLHAAAKSSWADVEPAIFGTLLERALDDRERHALGAHYTPRAYVERLVRPTIEEPLRREWDDVRVEARLLASGGKLDEARAAVGGFHRQLCTLRVLDPACGTGNFLYVALDTFKRVESEVLALLSELGDTQALLGPRVSPAQFLGIEVKPWAREIAELVLWIGHLSWNAKTTADVRGGLRASPRGPSWPPSPSASSPRGRMSRAPSTRPTPAAMLRAPGPVRASSPELSSMSASYWTERRFAGGRVHDPAVRGVEAVVPRGVGHTQVGWRSAGAVACPGSGKRLALRWVMLGLGGHHFDRGAHGSRRHVDPGIISSRSVVSAPMRSQPRWPESPTLRCSRDATPDAPGPAGWSTISMRSSPLPLRGQVQRPVASSRPSRSLCVAEPSGRSRRNPLLRSLSLSGKHHAGSWSSAAWSRLIPVPNAAAWAGDGKGGGSCDGSDGVRPSTSRHSRARGSIVAIVARSSVGSALTRS